MKKPEEGTPEAVARKEYQLTPTELNAINQRQVQINAIVELIIAQQGLGDGRWGLMGCKLVKAEE